MLSLSMHVSGDRFVLVEFNGVQVWVELRGAEQGVARVRFHAPPSVEITRGRLLEKCGRASRPEPVPRRQEFEHDGEPVRKVSPTDAEPGPGPG